MTEIEKQKAHQIMALQRVNAKLKAELKRYHELDRHGLILPDCDECKYKDYPRVKRPCLDCIGKDIMVDHPNNFIPIKERGKKNENALYKNRTEVLR